MKSQSNDINNILTVNKLNGSEAFFIFHWFYWFEIVGAFAVNLNLAIGFLWLCCHFNLNEPCNKCLIIISSASGQSSGDAL